MYELYEMWAVGCEEYYGEDKEDALRELNELMAQEEMERDE